MSLPRRHRSLVGSLSAALLLLPIGTAAQGIIDGGIEGCDFVSGQLETSCIPNFIGHLIQLFFGFAGVICLITVMYAGYEIAIGGATGDSTGGKQRLLYALIGLAVCICAFLLVDFLISALLGV